jgi:NAD(P)-dependent dehydrogenase (short-subunit alcohol dehydrogenase family)
VVGRRPEADRRAVFERTAAGLPVGRVGHPDGIAEVVAALVTSGFVTGHVLVADGGAHLARSIAV